MPYHRPSTSPDAVVTVPHSHPVIKTSRFSILHHQSVPLPNSPNGNEKTSTTAGHAKRMSKLPDIITVGLRRNRTTSLPQRPRSSDGRTVTVTGHRATSDPIEDSVTSVASSSLASGTCPSPDFLFRLPQDLSARLECSCCTYQIGRAHV